MTGILYGRLPGNKTGDIHLWIRESGGWKPACGDYKVFEELDSSHSSVLISDGTNDKILHVTQQESFKQANGGYCDGCLHVHHKVRDEWLD